MSGRGLRWTLAALCVAALAVLLAPPIAVGDEAGAPSTSDGIEGTLLAEAQTGVQYVDGRLVVGFEESASPETMSAVIESVDATVKRSLTAIDARAIEVPDDQTDEAIATLEASPAVDYVEPEVLLQAANVSPNDDLWAEQWGPRRVRAPAAWEATRGSAKVVVAVLDTGVDARHPDISGALVPGFDLVNNDAGPSDDNGHGTAVAGVIAARTNNERGQAGVCWNCSIMPVKVLGGNGSGTTSAIASGILWAVAHGADVINLSLGGTGTTSALADAVASAASNGVVVVAAAGNNGNTTTFYPAAYPQVLSVAGTTSSDGRYDWSNHGEWVKFAAPGCNVAPAMGGGYVSFCGTSSAAPLVSGIAGLAYSLEPTLTRGAFEQALRSAAVPLGAVVQSGRVDAFATLEALGLTPPLNVVRPVIRGTPRVGSVLEARKGSWAGNPTAVAYRWLRCNAAGRACSAIKGATGAKYRLTSRELGSKLRVVVRARNANGEKSARSSPTQEILVAFPATARTLSATGAGADTVTPPSTGTGSPPPPSPPPEGGVSSEPSTAVDTATSEVQSLVDSVAETAAAAAGEAVPSGP